MPTLILEITPETEQELVDAAQNGAVPHNSAHPTREQTALAALLAGLRNRPVPQTIDDLKPERVLPPGRTLKDEFEQFWRDFPDENTDEEVAHALEARKREKAQ